MAALLIRDLPPELHRKLKRSADRNRRSVTKEAIALLETALTKPAAPQAELPVPLRGNFPLTDDLLDRAKREGRE